MAIGCGSVPSGHSVPIGHSCGPKGREGGARKGRVQECRRRRSQLLASELSFWPRVFFLVWGRPSREDSESSQGFGSSKFPVERTLGYLSPLGWRPEGGSGGGSRQVLASASGGTVLSDQRRGASETGTVPTARVCHKEPFRARPHPSPEPARRSARTSGRRAGENRASGPCRTARQLYWIGTATSGHHNVPRGLAAEVGEGVHCPRRRRRGGLGSPRRRLGGDRVRQCA